MLESYLELLEDEEPDVRSATSLAVPASRPSPKPLHLRLLNAGECVWLIGALCFGAWLLVPPEKLIAAMSCLARAGWAQALTGSDVVAAEELEHRARQAVTDLPYRLRVVYRHRIVHEIDNE